MDTRLLLLVVPALLTLPAAGAGRRTAMVPEGFLEVEAVGVVPMSGGGTVLLADMDRTRLVPVSVGSTEALAIALRIERRRYERPLTYDLIDAILDGMGGEVVEARIDDLRSGTFVAHLTFREGRRTFTVDTRTSDAIAVALGRGVPLWLAGPVMDEAGLPWIEPEPSTVPDPTAPSL